MYTDFYGLREAPFNVTPDPRFLYLNDCYQEALAALGYGIDGRKGFITLVGEAGTGKTTLLRRVLDTLGPSTRSVLLLNPTVTFEEILELILHELGIPTDGGKLVRLQRLNEFLIEHTRAGGNLVLLIDEAQDLDPGVLEQLRLLSNLETAREKLLQIVLAGQPELNALLANPAMRQLRQRVTLRVELRPLTIPEVAEYMRSRLELAGATAGPFSEAAVERVAVLSQGVPRVVNVLSDAALLLGFALGAQLVSAAIVDEAWRDFELRSGPVDLPGASSAALAAALAVPISLPDPEPEMTLPAPRAPIEDTPAEAGPPAEDEAAAPSEPEGPRRMLNVPLAAAAVIIMAVTLHLTQRHLPADARDGVAAVAQDVVADVVEAGPEPTVPTPDVLAAVTGPVAPRAAFASGPPAPERSESVAVLEAAAVVEQFRRAFEARDSDRIAALFAADADENGRKGREAIVDGYRSQLATFDRVRYELPRVQVSPRGARTEVHAPFVISYQRAKGEQGEVRGEAEFALERRDGKPLIVALNYRLHPSPVPLQH